MEQEQQGAEGAEAAVEEKPKKEPTVYMLGAVREGFVLTDEQDDGGDGVFGEGSRTYVVIRGRVYRFSPDLIKQCGVGKAHGGEKAVRDGRADGPLKEEPNGSFVAIPRGNITKVRHTRKMVPVDDFEVEG